MAFGPAFFRFSRPLTSRRQKTRKMIVSRSRSGLVGVKRKAAMPKRRLATARTKHDLRRGQPKHLQADDDERAGDHPAGRHDIDRGDHPGALGRRAPGLNSGKGRDDQEPGGDGDAEEIDRDVSSRYRTRETS